MNLATTPERAIALRELHLRPIVWVAEDVSLQEVATVMEEEHVSAVIVGPHGAIVSERDVVSAVARGDCADVPAVSVASNAPISLSDDASALDALVIMLEHGVRHLVIVDESGQPVGILPLAAAAAAVVRGDGTPQWLTALRVVLRVDEVDG